MLLGTEKELAQKIISSLCNDPKGQESIREHWEKISRLILSHLIQNSTITGIAPPNGGPIVEGHLA